MLIGSNQHDCAIDAMDLYEWFSESWTVEVSPSSELPSDFPCAVDHARPDRLRSAPLPGSDLSSNIPATPRR